MTYLRGCFRHAQCLQMINAQYWATNGRCPICIKGVYLNNKNIPEFL